MMVSTLMADTTILVAMQYPELQEWVLQHGRNRLRVYGSDPTRSSSDKNAGSVADLLTIVIYLIQITARFEQSLETLSPEAQTSETKVSILSEVVTSLGPVIGMGARSRRSQNIIRQNALELASSNGVPAPFKDFIGQHLAWVQEHGFQFSDAFDYLLQNLCSVYCN